MPLTRKTERLGLYIAPIVASAVLNWGVSWLGNVLYYHPVDERALQLSIQRLETKLDRLLLPAFQKVTKHDHCRVALVRGG